MRRNLKIMLSMMIIVLFTLSIFSTDTFAKPKKVSLSNKKITMAVTEKKTIKIKNVKSKVEWESSDEEIVTVKASGKNKYKCKITAKGEGSATVTAYYKGKKYKCKVKVKSPALTDISELEYGKQTTISLKNVSSKVTFSVSDENIAKIVKKSKNSITLEGVNLGKVKIKTKYNGITYSMKLKVYHNHVFDKLVVLQKETCTENGKQRKDCVCGTLGTVTIVKAKGHSLKTETVTEPTCTTLGTEKEYCVNCPYSKLKNVKSNGHVWEEEFTIDKVSTCSENGSKSRHCKNCEMTKDITSLPKEEHSIVSDRILLQPTCESAGIEKMKCEVCNYSYNQTIEPEGHKESEEFEIIEEPSCTKNGVQVKKCTVCETELVKETIAKKEHIYDDGEVTLEPTCIKKGKRKYQCINCGETKEESINATNIHKHEREYVSKAPTCNSKGITYFYCTNEGCSSFITTTVKELGHTYSDTPTFMDGAENDCIKGGYTARYCIRGCGDYIEKTYTPPKGHTYSEEFVITVHPTCEANGEKCKKCKICDAETERTVIPATKHNFTNGREEVVTEPTCKNSGATKVYCINPNCTKFTFTYPSRLEHIYDEEGVIVKEATCTTKGEIRHYCKGNGTEECTEYISEEIEPSHDLTSKYVTEGQTCLSKGFLVQYCSVCDEEIERKEGTETLPHEWTGTIEQIIENSTVIHTDKCKNCKKTAYELYPDHNGNHWSSEPLESHTHIYNDTFDVITETSCGINGVASKKCIICDSYAYDIYNALTSEEKKNFDKTLFTIENAYTHEWIEIESEEPICGMSKPSNEEEIDSNVAYGEDGYKTYTCSHCGEEKTETWKHLEDHRYVICTYKEIHGVDKPEDSNELYYVLCSPNDYLCSYETVLSSESELEEFKTAHPTAVMYKDISN